MKVNNVNGTSASTCKCGSWLAHWKKFSAQSLPAYCSEKTCIKKLPFSCDQGQNGNYIFSKVVDKLWIPVYIGQGDINDRVNDRTHYNAAVGKGATHVHVHTNATEKDRTSEEQDLLRGHPEA